MRIGKEYSIGGCTRNEKDEIIWLESGDFGVTRIKERAREVEALCVWRRMLNIYHESFENRKLGEKF